MKKNILIIALLTLISTLANATCSNLEKEAIENYFKKLPGVFHNYYGDRKYIESKDDCRFTTTSNEIAAGSITNLTIHSSYVLILGNNENLQKINAWNLKRDGTQTTYYSKVDGGGKKEEASLKLNFRNGLMTRWYKNGNKQSEASYENDLVNGKETIWSEDGIILSSKNYINGLESSPELEIQNVKQKIVDEAERKKEEKQRLEEDRKQAKEEKLRLQEIDRQSKIELARMEKEDRQIKLKQKGDGSNNDLICQKYGFKFGSEAYSKCRMDLDIAQQQAEAQFTLYEEQKRQYEYEHSQREAAIAKAESDKRANEWFNIIMYGLGRSGGKTHDEAAPALYGLPMYPSQPPQPPVINIIPPISRPGQYMHCTYNNFTRLMQCN
jgi:antitoxin component YwqK of YwqJK toxin-antitoxin module